LRKCLLGGDNLEAMKFWSTFQVFATLELILGFMRLKTPLRMSLSLIFCYIPIDFDIVLQISPTHFDFMPHICEASRAAEGTSTKVPCQELGMKRFLMKSP